MLFYFVIICNGNKLCIEVKSAAYNCLVFADALDEFLSYLLIIVLSYMFIATMKWLRMFACSSEKPL